MKNKCIGITASLFFLSSLISCGNKMTGRILFELDGGIFPSDFGTTSLEGESGTPILTEIPDPVKEGYYFVGWREKSKDGSYRVINKRTYKDGKSYYFYPYVTDTFYAYFEPLSTITFDLNKGDGLMGLVAPKVDAASFHDNQLNGYASKKLLSTDYLPTVEKISEDSHLTFDGWYTKYPLVGVSDENGQKHYSLDSAGEVGEYLFERSFGTDNMCFPISEDNSFTLYAKWIEDPTVTIHYNLEGVEDSVFQGKGNISKKLMSEIYTKTGMDFNATDVSHFYNQDHTKRFNGIYLDSTMKTRFSLDSEIVDDNVDLYLGWDDRISVTMDYQSGTVNGKNSDTYSDIYYAGDVLGEEFYKAHIPQASNMTFLGYQLDGKDFNVIRDALPSHDVTLTATYSNYPTLTLHFDYPTGYEGKQNSTITALYQEGASIEEALAYAKASIIDESITASRFYMLNDGKKTDFTGDKMPSHDMELYLELDYLPRVTIESYYNPTSSYVSLTGEETAFYLPVGQTLTETFMSSYTEKATIDGSDFLFDGFYADESLSEKVILPISITPSHDAKVERTLYRKMTKAVSLTFVEKSSSETIGKVSALSGTSFSSSKEICALLGAYNHLTIVSGGSEKTIEEVPSENETIFVYR